MEKNSDILERQELKNAPFRVPEGYFESLGGRVVQRVAQEKRPGRTVAFRRWWIAAAAAACAAIFLVLLPGRPVTEFAAGEDSAEYLELMDLSDRSLAEYGEEDSQDDLSQEAIIEYLTYNNLSGAYLYEQLAEAE